MAGHLRGGICRRGPVFQTGKILWCRGREARLFSNRLGDWDCWSPGRLPHRTTRVGSKRTKSRRGKRPSAVLRGRSSTDNWRGEKCAIQIHVETWRDFGRGGGNSAYSREGRGRSVGSGGSASG